MQIGGINLLILYDWCYTFCYLSPYTVNVFDALIKRMCNLDSLVFLYLNLLVIETEKI